MLEGTDKEQRRNKQTNTHTQGNNKNNEGKQHGNKTQMENMQCVTTWKKGAERKQLSIILQAYENKNILHT
jgi:hypothetical protein